MSLLKATRYSCNEELPPRLSHYSAWLEIVGDRISNLAIIGANVNILRRVAPFAYFVANEKFEADEFGDNDRDYVYSLSMATLEGRISFSYPMHSPHGKTSIVEIINGDIFPFLSFIGAEEFSLLFLPVSRTSKEIDDIIARSSSNSQSVSLILSDGGFAVNVIDEVHFSVWTLDRSLGRYFVEGK